MASDRLDEPVGVVEPDNSTVDDRFGKNVARDQDVADRALAEGDPTYDAGHP